MKLTFKVYLALLIIFSFTLGMPKPAYEQEASLALNFIGISTSILQAAEVFLLLVTHVLLLFLLTMRQTPSYRYFIVYIPVAFWLAYLIITLHEHLIEPERFLSHLPFALCYILAIIQYNAITKVDPDYALGLPDKPEEEYEPRRFDTHEPM
jgi:hypothetical protein